MAKKTGAEEITVTIDESKAFDESGKVKEPTPKTEPIQLIPPTPEPPRQTPISDPVKQLTELDVQNVIKKELEPFNKLLEGKTPDPTPAPKEKEFGFLTDLGDLL